MTKLELIKSDILSLSPYPDKVKILAVSKTKSPAEIKTLFSSGHVYFGENYVQEFIQKIDLCPSGIQWHFIGHLQTNKINSLLGKVTEIHSVDSFRLAEQIDKKSEVKRIRQKIYLEINIGKEATKFGFSEASLIQDWCHLEKLKNVEILGLMCLPPPNNDDQIILRHFTQTSELLKKIKNLAVEKKHPLSELSMGTSSDYKLALKAGATIIRLGTILFGKRTL